MSLFCKVRSFFSAPICMQKFQIVHMQSFQPIYLLSHWMLSMMQKINFPILQFDFYPEILCIPFPWLYFLFFYRSLFFFAFHYYYYCKKKSSTRWYFSTLTHKTLTCPEKKNSVTLILALMTVLVVLLQVQLQKKKKISWTSGIKM